MNQRESEGPCHIRAVVVSQHEHWDLSPQSSSTSANGGRGCGGGDADRGIRGVFTVSLEVRTHKGNLEESSVCNSEGEGGGIIQLLKRQIQFCAQKRMKDWSCGRFSSSYSLLKEKKVPSWPLKKEGGEKLVNERGLHFFVSLFVCFCCLSFCFSLLLLF